MFKSRLKSDAHCIFVLLFAQTNGIKKFDNHRILRFKIQSMYALSNKVQLIGNLGSKPELKTTDAGKKLAKFSMATNETYRDAKGEKVKETQWHNLVAWGRVAEIAAKYLDKGSEVAIEGKLVSRSYNAKDGNKKYITEIQINELLMLGSKTVK